MSFNPNSRGFPSHEDSSRPVAIRAGLSVQVIINFKKKLFFFVSLLFEFL